MIVIKLILQFLNYAHSNRESYLYFINVGNHNLVLLQIAGASLFGIFLSNYETVVCLKLAARLMMWSLPVLVVFSLAVSGCFLYLEICQFSYILAL